MSAAGTEPLLAVANLSVRYRASRPWLSRLPRWADAVKDVSFELGAGETLGLVGETGSGKSTLARAVMRLTQPSSGSIRFQGEELVGMGAGRLGEIRRGMQMVFQDPHGSLNSRMRVEDIVAEGLDVHGMVKSRRERLDRVVELLTNVGLEPEHAARYPHEFSGGQRQRISIARALALQPCLLICDEPVSALDVSVQAQILTLLQDLQRRSRLALLFISHDLAVVEHISSRVMVMRNGCIVESGPIDEVIRTPRHPYTRSLLQHSFRDF